MQNILTISQKEFKAYFNSPIAYIFITIYIGLTNWLFFTNFFLVGQANMRGYFVLLPWIFLFFIPAITMRIWAEEKKMGTIELLLTWPVKDVEVVMGKFLAAFSFLLVTILCSVTIPVTIAVLGNPEPGPIVASYLGTLFLGAAYLAIGLFVSSLTENQIVAFILAIAVSFALFITGQPFVTARLPGFIVPIAEYVGISTHFESISRGVIDTRDLVYYLLLIGFLLFLNVRSIASRNWK